MNTAKHLLVMRILGLFFISFLLSGSAFAQTYTKAKTVDGDTVAKVGLPEFFIVANKQFMSDNVKDEYYRKKVLRRDIERVKPYVADAVEVFSELSSELDAISKKKDRKAYIKQKESLIQLKFEARIQQLTKQQGELFVKFIHRETGKTAHQWLQEIKGKSSAFYWQSMAKTAGANLKATYDPQGEDREIERVYTNNYR